jgi:hypothetical protein
MGYRFPLASIETFLLFRLAGGLLISSLCSAARYSGGDEMDLLAAALLLLVLSLI